MFDRFNRHINYLRISVTDRCNLRCHYCMPEDGVYLLKHSDIITFEEISEVANHAVRMGVEKIRLTGGEPLVRKGIVRLVAMLSQIKGLKDLSMTTNGVLLTNFARDLASAGLQRVNVSLDTLDAEKFRMISRGGNLEDVIEGIVAAKAAGLNPVKVNCVVINGSNEPDAQQVAAYCREIDLEVRFIHQMNLHAGVFSVVEGATGGNCEICNRLRLTANGKIKPCLFSDLEFDVKKLGAEQAIIMALENKPPCGTVNQIGSFYNIGG
jgi:GTP 3',8-cyclase